MKILHVSYQFASIKESIIDLVKDNPEWDINLIYEKTGIDKRYISGKKENAYTLAMGAARKLENLINFQAVELLIYVTQSPTHYIPSTAHLIHKELALSRNCLCFDLTQGCSGFIQSLFLAQSILRSKNLKNALIICADTYSKYISKTNKSCRPIFSDASSAIYLESSTNNCEFDFYTNSQAFHKLYLSEDNEKQELIMDGSYLIMEALKTIPPLIFTLIKKANKQIHCIDYFLFHQASKIMLENLFEKLHIPKQKLLCNYNIYGNTVSSSIPILIADNKNKLKNSTALLIGFGTGFSISACIMDF